MKRFLLAAFSASLLSLAVTAQAQTAPRIVSCTTPGDALGGLRISFATVTKAVIRESGMDGKTRTYSAAATSEDWAAFRAGRSVSFVWYPANAPMFGGAVSQASLLTLHARTGTQSKGFLSRGGTVFYLNCQN